MKLDGLVVDIDRVAEICARFGVVRLDVFGSFATGDADVDSDIDLLCELAPDRQLGWDIEELSEELEVALGRPVDLIARRSLHPQLRDTVLSEAPRVSDAVWRQLPIDAGARLLSVGPGRQPGATRNPARPAEP